MMIPKEKNKKMTFVCSCGYSTDQGSATITEQSKHQSKTIEVAHEKNVNPLSDAICKKCEHPRAHYWVVQTRAADESPTRFFKCEKCAHTWREK